MKKKQTKNNRQIKKWQLEVIRYIIVGGMTTAVSLGVYFLLTTTILNASSPLELQAANIISWVSSVTFAFFANRKYVFKSRNRSVVAEAASFYVSRLGTLLVEVISMFMLVSVVRIDDMVAKILVQFVTLVLNYLASKLLIFNKGKQETIASVLLRIKNKTRDKWMLASLAVATILLGAFISTSYAPDTYWDIMHGRSYVIQGAFLPSGRIITAMWVLLLKSTNLSYDIVHLISASVAIMFAALSIFLLKTEILDKKHFGPDLLTFVLAVAIVLNPLVVELMVYYEKSAMFASIFLCVAGAVQFNKWLDADSNAKKYLVKSAILAFCAVCCYQGTFGLYIVLLTMISLINRLPARKFILNTALSIFLYTIVPICNITVARIVAPGERTALDIDLFTTISAVIGGLPSILKLYGIVPIVWIYLFILTSMVTIVTTLLVQKRLSIQSSIALFGSVCYISLICVCAAIAPQLTQNANTVWMVPRTTYAIGCTVGAIGVVYAAAITHKAHTRLAPWAPVACCIIMLTMQVVSFSRIGSDNHSVSALDGERAAIIVDSIRAYEYETGKQIIKISPQKKNGQAVPYHGVRTFGDINVPAFSIPWATVSLINYWTGSNFIEVSTFDGQTNCGVENTNTPSTTTINSDSVYFREDTAILCLN